jgi:hypothetical protein
MENEVQLTAQYVVDYIEDPYGDSASDIAMLERYVAQETAALRAEMHATALNAANEAAALRDERDQAFSEVALMKHANAEMSAIVTQARERIEALLRELKR